MNARLQKLIDKAAHLQRQMWRQGHEIATRRETWLYAIMRVASISFSGFKENRIFVRAAALSFSSLLGLGPLIAIAVLISGMVLDQTHPDMAQDAIERTISFLAPQVSLSSPDDPESPSELAELINRFIVASKSGAVGIGGTLMLVIIVIQLFTSVEDAFNGIWGVQRGRNLVTRVILYWTTLTLGALITFAGLAIAITEIIKLTAQFGGFVESFPTFGLREWFTRHGSKFVGYGIVTVVLTAFYRFIPNTQVEWKASAIGAVFTAICFALNNAAAVWYMERVAMQRTLYGSLGLLPVLMLGLYLFWVFLLLGGRVSFAVQNARFKGGRIAWDELSHAAKESLCVLLFAQISRAFRNCQAPLSSKNLADAYKIPRPLASAALHRLCAIGFASSLPPEDNTPFDAFRYQPAKPLDRVKLVDFKRAFDAHGAAPDENLFNSYDPLVRRYHDLLTESSERVMGELSIESLLDECDTNASRDKPTKTLAVNS